MIAIQYSLVLPADYDMGIIERRIADRGHLTDGFPGLAFKAYLHARKKGQPRVSDNLYAPFYLWHTVDGMNDFLCGPGFHRLIESFGRPVVGTWAVWHAAQSPTLSQARYAIRETLPIAPHADLAALRRDESTRSQERLSAPNVLATVVGFEPTTWSVVRFELLRNMPSDTPDGRQQIYEVGHVSTG
jgi:hypothetical protein